MAPDLGSVRRLLLMQTFAYTYREIYVQFTDEEGAQDGQALISLPLLGSLFSLLVSAADCPPGFLSQLFLDDSAIFSPPSMDENAP